MNSFINVARYTINIHKSVVFQQTDNKHAEKLGKQILLAIVKSKILWSKPDQRSERLP